MPMETGCLQSLASVSTSRNGDGSFTPTSPRKCRRTVKLSQPWGQRNAYEPQKGIEVDALGALNAAGHIGSDMVKSEDAVTVSPPPTNLGFNSNGGTAFSVATDGRRSLVVQAVYVLPS